MFKWKLYGKKLNPLSKPNYINLNKLAIEMADGIIISNENINPQLKEYVENTDKLLLYHQEDDYIDMYSEFYDKLLLETIDEPA